MTKQAEALKLADELLADIGMSRLSAEKCILKGTRLARIISDDKASEWLRYELHGDDSSSPRIRELLNMTGRWVDDTKVKHYIVPLPALEGMLEAEKSRMNALQSTIFSGDYIVIAQNSLIYSAKCSDP